MYYVQSTISHYIQQNLPNDPVAIPATISCIILLVWKTGTATVAQAVIAAKTNTIHDTRCGVITIDSAVTMMASTAKTTAQDSSK